MITQCALFAAILCIFSPITIPIGPVPITLGVFAVMLTGVMLNWKKALISVAVYLLLGMCGLPLFSGGKSGVVAIAGPTGGYLWSYLIMVVVISLISRRKYSKSIFQFAAALVGCIVGVVICYICGTFQFTLVADYTWSNALSVCVYPFVPFDLLKAACASLLGVPVRNRLSRLGYEL